MNVVMVSTTALAGAPYENAKCINKYSEGIKVRWIAETTHYADGRVFPCDLLVGRDQEKIGEVIQGADLIHIQNEVPQGLLNLIQEKPLLVQFHSCPKRPSIEVLSRMTPHCYTVLQPMQLRVHQPLSGLPNLMDPEQYFPCPDSKRDRLQIVFAPTNDWASSYVGSKGTSEVLAILDRFKPKVDIDFFSGLVYEENLRRKQQADIIIDDVVNNTFNKTAIEGCCFGAAVISSSSDGGWACSSLAGLERDLRWLVEDLNCLMAAKHVAREWVTTKWHPAGMVSYYADAYSKVLQRRL